MSRLLLVTPARDEAEHLERTIRAVAAQTRAPDLWIVVDDGSTDETPRILARWQARLPFLRVHRLDGEGGPADGDRLAFAAEAHAFNLALDRVEVASYTHVGKLDADVELPPDYFERLLATFAAEPRLGVAGGILLEDNGAGWRPTSIPVHHVRGALKTYSRTCFEAIGGIEERLGWDTIDEIQARMHGFATRSIQDLSARHHRPVATRGGTLRGRARHGLAAYVLGYQTWWVGLKALKEAGSRPYVVSGAAYFYGYARAALGGAERVEDERFRRFVADELRARALPGRKLERVSAPVSEPAKVPAIFTRS